MSPTAELQQKNFPPAPARQLQSTTKPRHPKAQTGALDYANSSSSSSLVHRYLFLLPRERRRSRGSSSGARIACRAGSDPLPARFTVGRYFQAINGRGVGVIQRCPAPWLRPRSPSGVQARAPAHSGVQEVSILGSVGLRSGRVTRHWENGISWASDRITSEDALACLHSLVKATPGQDS